MKSANAIGKMLLIDVLDHRFATDLQFLKNTVTMK